MHPKVLTEEFQHRFRAKVDIGDDGDCWPWTGARCQNGYGYIWVIRKTLQVKAHRLAYFYEHGEFDESFDVLHRCDNPRCCNAKAHLFLGTRGDNNRDRSNKGRGRENRQWGEENSFAKLTEADVRAIVARVVAGDTQMAVAADFGIKQPQVSRLVRRQSWSHIWKE